ncbi:MAG TPA: LytR C-terminal domain-containing protein [Actinomycetota bacterium]|nr:LytR C-terminal domain-containing protein [Actinomycetota bacterium]
MRPGPTARAALVLASFLVLFVLVDRLSGPGRADRGTASGTTESRTTTATTRAPTSAAGTSASTRPPTTAGPTTTAPPTGSTLRPAEGVTVQVLNGAFVTGLAHRVATQVRAAGYQVVAANTALGNYRVSRVYYTAGHKADAEAFRERFPAFRMVAPAPSNLSRQVDLHAVIGQNYPGV